MLIKQRGIPMQRRGVITHRALCELPPSGQSLNPPQSSGSLNWRGVAVPGGAVPGVARRGSAGQGAA